MCGLRDKHDARLKPISRSVKFCSRKQPGRSMPQHRETASALPVQSSKCSKQRQTWTPSAQLAAIAVSLSFFSPCDSSANRIKTRRLTGLPVSLSSEAASMCQASRRSREAIGPLAPCSRWIRRARKIQDPKTSTPRREQITDGASKDHDASNGTHSGSLPCAVDCGALKEVVQG